MRNPPKIKESPEALALINELYTIKEYLEIQNYNLIIENNQLRQAANGIIEQGRIKENFLIKSLLNRK